MVEFSCYSTKKNFTNKQKATFQKYLKNKVKINNIMNITKIIKENTWQREQILLNNGNILKISNYSGTKHSFRIATAWQFIAVQHSWMLHSRQLKDKLVLKQKTEQNYLIKTNMWNDEINKTDQRSAKDHAQQSPETNKFHHKMKLHLIRSKSVKL